jgi:PKD repeat protein
VDAAAAHDARPIPDAWVGPDRVDPLVWVELTATGCDAGDDQQPCMGAAPLVLSFHAAAPAPVDTYRWSFGDGSPIDEQAAPTHRFDQPGVYDVTLTVGGPGGTATTVREAFVVVRSAALAAACELDVQCAEPATCLCASGDCPPGLADGYCTLPCASSADCGGALCAETAPQSGASAPWQGALCAPRCAGDGECRPGLRCTLLRSAEGGWDRGCFVPGALRAIGASCADADGAPDARLCAGGVCAPLGARGLCSDDCRHGGCPAGAACARFGDGGMRCLAACGPDERCDRDPWLACERADPTGRLGFSVADGGADARYCSPRRCAEASECGSDGRCADGFCAAR